MTRTPLISVLALSASLFLLAGCGQSEPEVVGGTPDPMAAELANAAPVELPPSIVATRTYRCRDNSLAYVTFFSDNSANFRTEPQGEITRLTGEAPEGPFTGEETSLSGSGTSVEIARPGAPSQSCNSN